MYIASMVSNFGTITSPYFRYFAGALTRTGCAADAPRT
jgi:hypothetical protein